MDGNNSLEIVIPLFGFGIEHVLQASRIDVKSVFLNIAKDRFGSNSNDGPSCGKKCKGSCDHRIPRAYPQSHQGNNQCIRTGRHPAGKLCPAVVRKFLFKRLHFRPEDKPLRGQGFEHLWIDFVFNALVLGFKIQHGNIHVPSRSVIILKLF